MKQYTIHRVTETDVESTFNKIAQAVNNNKRKIQAANIDMHPKNYIYEARKTDKKSVHIVELRSSGDVTYTFTGTNLARIIRDVPKKLSLDLDADYQTCMKVIYKNSVFDKKMFENSEVLPDNPDSISTTKKQFVQTKQPQIRF